jgi:glutathione S-transferase
VLDRHLADNEYMAGTEYTIADMAIWPWYGLLAATTPILVPAPSCPRPST